MRSEDVARMDRIIAALGEIADNMDKDTSSILNSGDHIEMAHHFVGVRETAERVKTIRELMYRVEDTISRERIPEMFKSSGIKTLTLDKLGRVTVSYKWSASMLDKEGGMRWLTENGHGGLIQPTVNSSTLSAFARNLMETEGKELPSDLFKTGQMAYTSITKK